jgi:hypothetical protein
MNAGKGIVGHGGNGAPAPPVQQINLTRTVKFLAADVQVATLPNGNRLLTILDPGSATAYSVELPNEGARQIGQALISSVQVAGADEMPGAAS